jgi:spoIIIJ-associated protein
VDYSTGEDGGGDEVEVAEEFVTGLLETFGGSFDIERRPLEEDLVELSVRGDGLGLLIGPRGQTLAAVQELTRTVVQRRWRGRSGRILVDIAGYRQARRAALERFAAQVADEVRASGVARVLEPMPPADRKVVHDAINAIDGVATSSEGEEPNRRVVISPQPAPGDDAAAGQGEAGPTD